MKKLLAILMSFAIVFCFAACGDKTADEPSRSMEELIADIEPLAEKLADYKADLDPQLLLVNSADNNDKFFDLAGMAETGAAFDALFAQMELDPEALTDGDATDGDAAAFRYAATAKAAADQIAEISEKINTAAQHYYAQFVAAYPDAEITKLHCLTVFMSGEPSSFFAATYTDAQGAEQTVYSVSSFTAGTPEDVLASMHSYLFTAEPVKSRNAVADGNFNIDLTAVKAAVAPAEDAVSDGNVSDGNVSDGNAK